MAKLACAALSSCALLAASPLATPQLSPPAARPLLRHGDAECGGFCDLTTARRFAEVESGSAVYVATGRGPCMEVTAANG